MQYTKEPYMIEKILSAASYLTAGGVGMVWLIIAALMKKQVTQFLMYHIMQSIFLSILFFLFTIFCRLISFIPILNMVPYLINIPLIFGYSAMQLLTSIVIFYAAITSFMGQYSYIPWVSDVINGNCGRGR